MKATINASPLIFLARIEKIDLLNNIFTDFYVTDIVWEEAVKRGLGHRYIEAELIQRTIGTRLVEIEKGRAKKLAEKFGIHVGEAFTILLAKKLNFEYVIVDGRVAIKVAKIMGLKPLSTPFILLKALKDRHLTYEEFMRCFEKLVAFGYYISPVLYREILKRAEEMEPKE